MKVKIFADHHLDRLELSLNEFLDAQSYRASFHIDHILQHLDPGSASNKLATLVITVFYH